MTTSKVKTGRSRSTKKNDIHKSKDWLIIKKVIGFTPKSVNSIAAASHLPITVTTAVLGDAHADGLVTFIGTPDSREWYVQRKGKELSKWLTQNSLLSQ